MLERRSRFDTRLLKIKNKKSPKLLELLHCADCQFYKKSIIEELSERQPSPNFKKS